MPAYVIVDIDVRDPETYEKYKALAPASIAAHGGRYVARGGAVEVLEGDWKPGRLVLLEFESLEKAKQWAESPEYAAAKALRHRASKANMVAVEGLNSP